MLQPRPRILLAPEDRRRQLLEAATWVFARKGYRHANISDIIARAGVARGTFYLYFKSKEQVFLAIVEEFHGRITRALADAAEPTPTSVADPRAMLRVSARRWLEFFAAHRDAATVVLKEASSIDPRFEQGFSSLRQSAASFFAARLRRLQALGLANPRLSPDLFARLQLGMFDELLNAYVLATDHADLDALAEQLAEFEWNGIRPDRATSH
jgi:AcrR family transcriptional regulator